MFLASDEGSVKMYSRKKVDGEYRHKFEANILSHESDVSDLGILLLNLLILDIIIYYYFLKLQYLDISLNEEYVISASQSREVGLATLIPIEF